MGYSPWGRKELDTTEQLHFHYLLSGFLQRSLPTCSLVEQMLRTQTNALTEINEKLVACYFLELLRMALLLLFI